MSSDRSDHESTTDHTSADVAIAEKARELRKTANRMVGNAKQADKEAKRLYEPGSYITADRIVSIMKAQDGCCYFYCGVDMVYGRGVNRVTNGDAVTLERMDSNLAHVADNCILACSSCNRSKSDNIPFDVMRLWAVPIKQRAGKWCNSCQTIKCVAQFGRDKSRSDGISSRCRACNTIHCARTEANKKRKLAAMEEEVLSSEANLDEID